MTQRKKEETLESKTLRTNPSEKLLDVSGVEKILKPRGMKLTSPGSMWRPQRRRAHHTLAFYGMMDYLMLFYSDVDSPTFFHEDAWHLPLAQKPLPSELALARPGFSATYFSDCFFKGVEF